MNGRLEETPEGWWATSIIDMQPGAIRYRGYAIEELIGKVGFAEMIWLLTRGDLPDPRAARLLECALVAAVDHGPQAPSIAIARMAMTCGVGINNAMASAINVLGDVHGGAGEQCVQLYNDIAGTLGPAANDAEVATASRPRLMRFVRRAESTCPGSGTAFTRSIRALRVFLRWLTRQVPQGSFQVASPRSPARWSWKLPGAGAARRCR